MEERDESQEEEAKKATYSELLAQILRQNLDAEDALRVSKELLLINPDHYHAWNRRKEALLKTDPSLASLIVNELEFSVEALKLNPKSYPSWYHRRWLLGTVQPEIARAIAPNELRLCSKLLQLDARNFHCWNYRAFLCDELLRRSCEEELVFSKEMIGSNFSNYSAWHRRAVVISRLDPNKKIRVVKEDMEMIKSAIYTDPTDQCAWFYLRFFAKEYLTDSDRVELIKCLKELEQEEPNCECKPPK